MNHSNGSMVDQNHSYDLMVDLNNSYGLIIVSQLVDNHSCLWTNEVMVLPLLLTVAVAIIGMIELDWLISHAKLECQGLAAGLDGGNNDTLRSVSNTELDQSLLAIPQSANVKVWAREWDSHRPGRFIWFWSLSNRQSQCSHRQWADQCYTRIHQLWWTRVQIHPLEHTSAMSNMDQLVVAMKNHAWPISLVRPCDCGRGCHFANLVQSSDHLSNMNWPLSSFPLLIAICHEPINHD